MKKYEPQHVGESLAVQGWVSAALIAAGIRAAGNNLTQKRVIQLTNQIANFTGEGMTPITDWQVSHTGTTTPSCDAFTKVSGKQLVTVMTPGHQVFLCFKHTHQEPEAGDAAGRHAGDVILRGEHAKRRPGASMSEFLGYVTNGVPYGCTYAIVAVGLVLTYQATGVFNFAFGAQAYASAFVFAILVQNEGLPVWAAFFVSVVFMAPLLGLVLDRYLFRLIPNTNTTAKVVTGLALLVGIPTILPIIFGNTNIYNVSSVLFDPNTVYFRLFGQPINGIYLSSILATAVVLILLVGLMRFTNLGLQMRGAVESRRLVQLDGINAGGVVSIAWAISSLLAGLAGVLLAPIYGQLQSQDYITLMVAAIAAAAWAVLRSMPIAALTGILIGVVELVAQGYLPTNSLLYTAVLPSLPFIILVLALLFVPDLRSLEENKDPLASVDPPPPPPTYQVRVPQLDRIIKVAWYALLAAFIVSMLTWMPPTWENVFNSGLAFSTIFLSITLITGMAGQLSLAQATLAGVGAFTAAQLAHHLGLNMLLGGLVGAVLAAAVAVVLAVLSLRLKGLGLALMTLAAALFFDNTVFADNAIGNGQGGISLKPAG